MFCCQVPVEILGLAQQIYNKANYSYGDDAPCCSAVRLLEEAMGTDLRYTRGNRQGTWPPSTELSV